MRSLAQLIYERKQLIARRAEFDDSIREIEDEIRTQVMLYVPDHENKGRRRIVVNRSLFDVTVDKAEKLVWIYEQPIDEFATSVPAVGEGGGET